VTAVLSLYETAVHSAWIDYNGHMSEAYYVLIFGYATDAFLDHIELDDAARRAEKSSVYTLEAHINYLDEVAEGTPVRVESRILGYDKKRVHLYHEMFRADSASPVAATELMLLHVDKSDKPAASPFPARTAEKLASIATRQAPLERPKYCGRIIGLR